jgi:fructose-1,6-bisphosphatase
MSPKELSNGSVGYIFAAQESSLRDTIDNSDAQTSGEGHFAAADYWYGPTIAVATTAPRGMSVLTIVLTVLLIWIVMGGAFIR